MTYPITSWLTRGGIMRKQSLLLFKTVFVVLFLLSCGGGGGGSTPPDTSDTTAPSVPSGLTVTVVSSSRIDLSWVGSTDNVAVAGYKIYREGALRTSVTTTAASDTNLSGGNSYCYSVSAYDASNNQSARTAESCKITQGGPGAPWSMATLDTGNGVYPSIAVDANGKVHISHNGAGDLMYTSNVTGTWQTETVDSFNAVIDETSIALDSAGKAHISYYDETDNYLMFGTNESGAWSYYAVENVIEGGAQSSIVLNSANKLYISYYIGNSNYANLALATPFTLSNWTTSYIDTPGIVGQYTSIGRDSNDKLHISYFDYTNKDLKYATDATGVWVTSTVDSAGDVGLSTSIAIDSNNKVHISYFDITNRTLKYATNASGSWITTTIESVNDFSSSMFGIGSRTTSIDTDSNNKVHISYYNALKHDLKYATNASNSWVTATIDGDGNVGFYNSLAVDSTGRVHIAYTNYTDQSLKYAVSQ